MDRKHRVHRHQPAPCVRTSVVKKSAPQSHHREHGGRSRTTSAARDQRQTMRLENPGQPSTGRRDARRSSARLGCGCSPRWGCRPPPARLSAGSRRARHAVGTVADGSIFWQSIVGTHRRSVSGVTIVAWEREVSRSLTARESPLRSAQQEQRNVVARVGIVDPRHHAVLTVLTI